MKEVNQGEIYYIKNLHNGKGYVGQAKKYVSENNNSWGTLGRWKSHVREAYSEKDHCVALNNAIRKYGSEGFEVTKICDCLLQDMDNLEEYYIKQYKTLIPDGYNIRAGGSISKFSVQSKNTTSIHRKGRTHSAETKQKISLGQLGNRRNTKTRKNIEDTLLPKYIVSKREGDVVIGYAIQGFPVGVTTKEYISKSFVNKSAPELALTQCKEFLKSLQDEHKEVQLNIKDNKIDVEKQKANAIVGRKVKLSLPEYVYPVLDNTTLVGYSVQGLQDFNGNPIPKKEFTQLTNRWNLDRALKFIQTVDVLNNSHTEVKDWDTLTCDVRKSKKGLCEYHLPQFLITRKYKGELAGFIVQICYIEGDKNLRYIKSFTNKKHTLDENYKMACEHLILKKKELNVI